MRVDQNMRAMKEINDARVYIYRLTNYGQIS